MWRKEWSTGSFSKTAHLPINEMHGGKGVSKLMDIPPAITSQLI